MEAIDDAVPKWVAGLLGSLSFALLLFVVYVHGRTRKETLSATDRCHFCQGLLRSLFDGRFLLSVLATLSIFAVATIVTASPLLLVHEKRGIKTSIFEKWGSRASINFCEGPDFSYSQYVAEPINTMTSLGFYVGTASFSLCGPGRFALRGQYRFYLCYLSLLVIGLGSAALHASLAGSMQGCDELPMLYILTMFGFCACDSLLGQWGAMQARSLLPVLTFALTLSSTCVYVLNREVFAVFGMIFTAYLTVTVSYGACYCLGLTSVASNSKLEEEVRHHVVIPLGLAMGVCYACGGICWGLEMGFCSSVINGHLGQNWAPFVWRYALHSTWHATTAMAAHLSTLFFMAIRSQELGWGKPALDWSGLPLIYFHDKA